MNKLWNLASVASVASVASLAGVLLLGGARDAQADQITLGANTPSLTCPTCTGSWTFTGNGLGTTSLNVSSTAIIGQGFFDVLGLYTLGATSFSTGAYQS